MESVVRVKFAAVELRQDRTYLTLTTTENLDIEFELDDVANALLAITAGGAMKVAARKGVPTVFADES